MILEPTLRQGNRFVSDIRRQADFDVLAGPAVCRWRGETASPLSDARTAIRDSARQGPRVASLALLSPSGGGIGLTWTVVQPLAYL